MDAYLFPLSFAQERLWFLDQMMPRNPFYTLPVATRQVASLDIAVLRASLDELVRRHEILRTTIRLVQGQPFQMVQEPGPVELPVIDLRALPSEEREAEARRLATIDSAAPFELAVGPLFRTRLLRLYDHEHIFLLTMHHIVSDGWSVGIFFRELGALYDARLHGQAARLGELRVQYGDFAIWQRQWLRGEALEQRIAYWAAKLEGLEPLELPIDLPRPRAQSFRGGLETFAFSKQLSARALELGRREGVTPFVLLLTVFKTLLRKYTGQKDIVVGSPIAGRNRTEFEPLIGFFVNSLVLRTDFSGTTTFRQALKRVQATVVEALSHQDLPFEKLVEALQPERDLGRNPVYQVSFQYLDIPTIDRGAKGPAPQPAHASVAALPFQAERGTALFDLSLTLVEFKEGIRGQFEYSSDLFRGDTVRAMAQHFTTLAEAVVADPQAPLSALPILSPQQRRHQLQLSRGADAPGVESACLHELFERQARRTPDAAAIEQDGASLTYRELDALADRLAARLAAQGVRPEDLVGLCALRAVPTIAAMLGVLKAGAGYVPLDPGHPPQHLAGIVADSRIRVLIADARGRAALAAFAGATIELEHHAFAEDVATRAAPGERAVSDNLAYVIYTSGSSGRPKGVMVTHGALCNHMAWFNERFPMTQTDRVLQKTPLTFDASVWEIYAPLLSGACLVLAPQDAHRDSAYLARAAERLRISVLQLVPTQLHALLQEPGLESIASLKRLFCGGEALPADLVRRAFDRLAPEVINLYGPTEATIDAAFWVCPADEQVDFVPIGHPIANVRCYVLDEDLSPLPTGMAGELHIGGAALARGYVGQPRLTAEQFIPDPFDAQPGARLYRTGDKVKRLDDGRLVFLGRMDGQVKLRGYRIELAEIEACLRQHPAVHEAAVVVREDGPGDRRVIAYVVVDGEHADTFDTAPGAPLKVGDLVPSLLRRFLQERFPDYMVPAAFVRVPAIPRTTSGKLNRRALPAPGRERPELERPRVAPRNALEEVLAQVWADILHLEQVGVNDGFFVDLGGHSLIAAQLVARVNELFHTEVPLRRIFDAPTVVEFAAAMAADGQAAALEEAAQLLLTVERLSDAEVARMLGAQ